MPRRLSWVLFSLSLALIAGSALLLLFALPARGAAANVRPADAPLYTHTIATGAYLAGTWTADFGAEMDWLDEASGAGRQAELVLIYGCKSDAGLIAKIDEIIARNKTPLITWEPYQAGVPGCECSLQQIVDGVCNSTIDSWAQALKNLPAPVYLRWGHEMNGNWYPWSGANNGQSAQPYIDAWRYVHDRVEITHGVDNVRWVWTPNNESVPAPSQAPWNAYHNYYPGDAYVDWVGASGYNWGSKATWEPKPPCRSFDDLFGWLLNDMVTRYPTKPQLIPEFASACDNGCDKPAWIAATYDQALAYPNLAALVWFNVAKTEGGSQFIDWRIGCGETDAPACSQCLATFSQQLAGARYGPWADFSAVPTGSVQGFPVRFYNDFENMVTGRETSWQWRFGDGSDGTGQNALHAYGATGSYTVSLTVSGLGGSNVVTHTHFISVTRGYPLFVPLTLR